MIRFSLRKLFVLTLIVCGVFAAARMFFASLAPVVPRAHLEQLVVGMTKYEVEAILGKPTRRRGASIWVYERPFNPARIGISFDEQGRLESVNNKQIYP